MNFLKKSLANFFSVLFIINPFIFARSYFPEREFRGAWIATVVNLDWPSEPGLPVEEQKKELTRLLDALSFLNFNTVIFQVRPECDAFYKSEFEPWSYWLTGEQGKAPDPFYDPLEFAITEAHKRGMKLHAWINPYRAVRKVGTYKISEKHVTKKHPGWIITSRDLKYLNPGLPAVRNYVKNVVEEIIKNYDVDGIHLDDYFYPYPPHEIGNEDAGTFKKYNRGFKNIADWRRDNVNLLIGEIYRTIKKLKPDVTFGISPFGIWRNNIPNGITGFDAYNRIYADALNWIENGIVDYLVPQLYWPFGGGQDFAKLSDWWSLQKNDTQFYAGLALYRTAEWDAGEIPEQIRYLRTNPFAEGFVFFRAANLLSNNKGITDSLMQNYLRYGALIPPDSKMNLSVPSAPENLKFIKLSENRGKFEWQGNPKPENVTYVILSGKNDLNRSTFIDGSPNILYSTDNNYLTVNFIKSDIELKYAITAVNRSGSESEPGNVVSAPPIIKWSNYKLPAKFSIKKLKQLNGNYYDFEFEVPKKSFFRILLVNPFGRKIAVFSNSILEKGVYKISLPAGSLMKGIYYFAVSFENKFIVVKTLL